MLVSESIRYVLTMPRRPLPNANMTREAREEYDRWVTFNNKAIAYMSVTMSDVLRAKFEAKESFMDILDVLQCSRPWPPLVDGVVCHGLDVAESKEQITERTVGGLSRLPTRLHQICRVTRIVSQAFSFRYGHHQSHDMFATAGLFSKLPCPEKERCKRPNCLFSHSPDVKEIPTVRVEVDAPKASSSKSVAGPSPSSSKIKPNTSTTTLIPAKRPTVISNEGPSEPPRKLLKVGPASKPAALPSASVAAVCVVSMFKYRTCLSK